MHVLKLSLLPGLLAGLTIVAAVPSPDVSVVPLMSPFLPAC